MRRAERLAPGTRISARQGGQLVSGEIRSEGVVIDDQRYFDVVIDGGGESLVADAELTPELGPDERPHEAFVQVLAQHRESKLNELVEIVLEKLGELYDQDIHLVEELIQNAEDAEASQVAFVINDDAVSAQNNGLPFSRHDIDTITWVVRERSKAPGKIGRHGIGFRSVYAVTQRPSIRSGDVAFAIEHGLVPRLLPPPDGVDRWGTTFDLPYRVARAKNGQAYPEYFAGQLQHFNVRTLLFLRNIWRLSVESTTTPAFTLYFVKTEEASAALGGALVRLYRGSEPTPTESWLLFRDPPSGAVEDAVELAFRLEAGELTPCADGVLHIFLPTRIRTHLPFVVSADFTPNKGRNAIVDDEIRNPELLRRAGTLLADAAEKLRKVGSARSRLLSVLPLQEHADPALLQPLIAAAQASLRAKQIVPVRGGGWATPEDALLLRPEDRRLADLLTPEDLTFVFGRSRSIVELPAGSDAHARKLLEELAVETWGYEHLRSLLDDPDRLRGREPAWFAELYAYLHTYSEALYDELRDAKLVLCEDGELRSAADGVLLPLTQQRAREVYELFGDRYVLVHEAVVWPEGAADDAAAALAFLRQLGLEQLSYTKVIEEWVLPAFTADPCPDESVLDRYVEFLRRRLEPYRRERLDDSPSLTLEQALAPVRDGLRLRARPAQPDTRPVYHEPGRLVLADVYRDQKSEGSPPRLAGIREVDPAYLELGASGAPKRQAGQLRTAWREFLLAVGVQDAVDPVWVIEHVVLPRHASEGWKEVSADDLLRDLDFVRRHASQYQEWARPRQPATQRSSYSAYRELGKVLWVRTKRAEGGTNYYDRPPNLYLPTEARIQADLEALFPSEVVPPARFIHALYFQRKPRPGEMTWPAFFEALGAANKLRVVHTEREEQGTIARDPRRAEGGWPNPVRWIGGLKNDWAAPDLAALFKLLPRLPNEERVRTARLTLEILEAGWARGEPVSERYSSKLRAELQYDQPRQRQDVAWQSWPWPSEFSWLLRRTAWLPDTDGSLRTAEEVFADTPQNRQLVGTVRPLLAFQLPTVSEVARFLKLDREPTLDAVLDHLAALADAGAAPDPELVPSIYQHLARRLTADNADASDLALARQRFAEEPLLYLPGDDSRWRSAAAVFFTGPRDVFAGHRAYLKPHYPRLWPLFQMLGITESPSVPDYLRFVADELPAGAADERLALAARAWVAAARLILEQGGPDDPEVAAALRALPCLMAENGGLHSASGIWLDDDPMARAAVRDFVPVLALPSDVPVSDVRPLLDWLHVPSLAGSVRRAVVSSHLGREAPEIEWRVRGVVDFVQRWLFHRHPTHHEAAMQAAVYERMAAVRAYMVDDLAVTYSLDGVTASAPADAVLLVESGALYCRTDAPDEVVAPELARLFGTPDGLPEFLMMALPRADSPNSLAAFLERTGVRALPQNARRWRPEEAPVPATAGDQTSTEAGAPRDSVTSTSREADSNGDPPTDETREQQPGATFGERMAAELERGTAAEQEDHQYGGSLGLPVETIFEQGEAKVEEVRRRIQRRIEEDRTSRETAPRHRVTRTVTGRQLVSELRAFLLERYHGRCQICGDNFRNRNSEPFFITHHLLPFARDGFDTEANVLCLCPKHSAMLHHAICRIDLDQATSDPVPDTDGLVRVAIEMDGRPEQIAFTPDHHWPFAELCRMPIPVAATAAAG